MTTAARPAPAEAPAAPPRLNRAQRRRQEKLRKARPAPPPVAVAETAADGSDAAFRERAIKTFAATFAQAPPHLHAALDRLTPQQRLALIERCWPKDEEFDASPQGP